MRAPEVKALLHASTCTHEGGEKCPGGTAMKPPHLLGNNIGIGFDHWVEKQCKRPRKSSAEHKANPTALTGNTRC